MKVTQMTLDEIKKNGIDALARKLGPYGMVRFLQQYEAGKGNYSLERDQWLPGNMKTIIEGINKLQKAKNGGK